MKKMRDLVKRTIALGLSAVMLVGTIPADTYAAVRTLYANSNAVRHSNAVLQSYDSPDADGALQGGSSSDDAADQHAPYYEADLTTEVTGMTEVAEHGSAVIESELRSADGDVYTVRLKYDAAAEIPEGTVMTVRELVQQPSEEELERPENIGRPYASEEFVSAETLAGEFAMLSQGFGLGEGDSMRFAKFLDISLTCDGAEIEPEAPVEITIETGNIDAAVSDSLELAIFTPKADSENTGSENGDTDRYIPLETANLTGMDDEGSRAEGPAAVRLGATVGRLGRFCLASVVKRMLSWVIYDMRVSVYGPRSMSASARKAPAYAAEGGCWTVDTFSIETDPEAYYGTTLWMDSVPTGTSTDGFYGGISAVIVRDGVAAEEIFGIAGTDEPAPFRAGESIALIWDSGYRNVTLTKEDVTLEGVMPMDTDIYVADVTEDYTDSLPDPEVNGEARSTIAAYDISLQTGGGEYQPGENRPVTVSIANEAIDESKELEVWQVRGDGTMEQVNAVTVENGTVAFQASEMAVYVVTEYTIDTNYKDFEGHTWRITATYGSDTGIPSDAELVVRELTDEESEAYLEDAAGALGEDVEAVRIHKAFDIRFVKGDTEYHDLNGNVRITIQLLDEEFAQDTKLVHMGDQAEEIGASVDGDTLSFDSSAFSIYVVVQNEPTISYYFVDPDGKEYTRMRQTLKSGAILAQPESPSDGGRTFDHWTLVNDPADPADPALDKAFNGWGVVTVPELPEGRKYPIIRYLKAVYAEDVPQIRVTYYDQNGRILRSDYVASGTRIDPEEVAYTALQVNNGEYLVFQYWTQDLYALYDETGNEAAEGTPRRFDAQNVTSDVDLYPYCTQFHWIYFDGNKRESEDDTTRPLSVAYTPPQLVAPGVTPAAAPVPASPVGYRFTGWFTRPDDTGSQVFMADGTVVSALFTAAELYHGGSKLNYDLTLYAHWEAEDLATFSVVVYKQRAGDSYDAAGAGYHYDFKDTVVASGTYMAKSGSQVRLEDINTVTVEQAAASSPRYDTAKVMFTGSGDVDTVAYTIDMAALLAGESGSADPSDLIGFKLDTVRSEPVTVHADGTTVFRIYLSRRSYHLIFKDYQWHGGNSRYNPLTSGITPEMLTRTYSGKAFPTVKEYDALYGQDISKEFPVYDANGRAINSLGYYLNAKNTSQLVTGGYTAVLTGNSWLDADGSSLGYSLFKRIDYLQALKHDTEYFVHNSINAQTHRLVYYLEVLDPAGITTGTPVNGKDSPQYVKLDGKTFERLGSQLNYGGGGFSASLFYDIDGFSQYKAMNIRLNKTISSSSDWNTANSKNDDAYLYYTRDSYYVNLKYVRDGGAPAGSERLRLPYETPITAELLASYYNDLGSIVSLAVDGEGNDIWWYNDKSCHDEYDLSNAKVPNHDITIYKGVKTSVPVQVDADGGVLDGKNGSTWFNVENGELISEYTVSREYVPVEEAGVDYDTLRTAYKYVRHPYNTEIDGAKARTATYVELTEAELNYLITNKNGRYMDGADTYSDGVAYVYSPGVYKFQYWYSVTASFDNETKTFTTNEKASDSKKAYNFTEPALHPLYLKAKWADASTYTIVYDAGEDISVPIDPKTYNDGSGTKAMASKGRPSGKLFRFWATVAPGEGQAASDFAALYPDAARYASGKRVYPDVMKYAPNEVISMNRNVTADRGAERVIKLYAWYDAGSFSGEAATYDFYVQDSSDFWHDGEEDIPYYEEIISPGEELIVPDTPADPRNEGRVFTGWYLDKEWTQRFNEFGVVSQPVNRRLYAGFAKVLTVTYMDKPLGQSGVRKITEQRYIENEPLNTSGISPILTNEQYVARWTTNGNDSYPYNNKGSAVTADMTLYPVLGAIYTIAFDSQGGTYVAPITFPKDLGQWAPAPEPPARKGYAFKGWWTEKGYSGLTADGTRTDSGTQYSFDKALVSWAAENNIDPVPAVLYAHWERNGEPIETSIKVNYWVQNTDRKGYTLQNTGVFKTDENGSAYLVDGAHALNAAEKALTNMSGYYTFSEDQAAGKPDDASAGYFELGTVESTDGGLVLHATETDAKTILENGETEYNVYFNRKVYRLVFEPDRQYIVNEQVGIGRYLYLALWHDCTKDSEKDNTNVTYSVDGGFTSLPAGASSNSDGDYEIADVWLGMDVSAIWLTDENIKPVQNSKTQGQGQAKLDIDYTSMDYGNHTFNNRGFKITDVNHANMESPFYYDGDRFGTSERTFGYHWYNPWVGDEKGGNKWANAFYFNGWAVCEGVIDGSAIVNNKGERNVSFKTNIDSIKNKTISSKQFYIDRSVLFKSDPANDTITLVAEYGQTNVYTSASPKTNPVEVRYFLINKDANGNDIYIPMGDDYTQVVYNVPGTGSGTGWRPSNADWNTVEGKMNLIPGYSHETGIHDNSVAGRPAYGVDVAGGVKEIQLYDYYLPVDTYYHRIVGGFYHDLRLDPAGSGSPTKVKVNGRWYWKVTGTGGKGVEEGQYDLIYRNLLLGRYHADSDVVYTFPARKLHIARYASGMSTMILKGSLETTYDDLASLPAEGGRIKNGIRTETINNNTNFMNLYFRPGKYVLKLRSTNAADNNYSESANKHLLLEYTTYVTNAENTDGAIYEAIRSGKYTEDNTPIPRPVPPEGYEFKCWSTSPTSDAPFEGTMPNYSFTLYAQFKPRDFTVITMGVDSKGALQRTEGDTGEIVRDEDGYPLSWWNKVDENDEGKEYRDYEATRLAGTKLMEYELPAPALSGYEVFYGWKRLNEDNTLSAGYVTSTTTVMDDLILVPDIRRNESGRIQYFKNATEQVGDTVGPYYSGSTTRASAGTVNGLPGSEILKDAEGRTFVYWTNLATGDVYFPGDSIAMPEAGVTLRLFAVYSKVREVTLIYHLNGGTGFVPLNDDGSTTISGPETVDGETVMRLYFSNYDENSNHSSFPNVAWPVSTDINKVGFMPQREGYAFIKWNTEPDGSGMDVLSTDTIRIDTLPLEADNTHHLYAQWARSKLLVTVYEAWYGDLQAADARSVLEGKSPYLESVESRMETAEYTANTWYNAYDRNGLTINIPGKTNYVFLAAYPYSGGRASTDRLTHIRYNADNAVWQYSTDNQASWEDFDEQGLSIYYFPEEIKPIVYYVIENPDGSLTEVKQNVYNITIQEPDTINTHPDRTIENDPVFWVATTLDSVRHETNEARGVLADPGFHLIGVESDCYLFAYIAAGPGELAKNAGELGARGLNLYAQNTRDGIRYADERTKLNSSTTPRVGVSAVYVVYEPGDPICKIVHDGREHPFKTLKSAVAYAENHMGGAAVIEMLRDYSMPVDDKVTIAAADDIVLTTAEKSGAKFCFRSADEAQEKAVITRGFDGGSMFTNEGKLSFDKLVIDGDKTNHTGGKGAAVLAKVDSTTVVGGNAEIRNSKTDDVGGAVYIDKGRLDVAGTIERCTAVKGGAIYAEQGSADATPKKSVVNITGTLKGNSAELGGAVKASENTLITIGSGALITNNEATDSRGGAVYAEGRVNMEGGEVSGNMAKTDGAAIYIGHGSSAADDDNGKLYMSGGIITGNSSNSPTGGAVKAGEGSELHFSGDAQVADNPGPEAVPQVNVVLNYNTSKLIFSDGLGEDAKIGVYVVDGTDGAIFDERGGANDRFGKCMDPAGSNLSNFINDRNGLVGGPGADSRIIWVQQLKVKAVYAPSVDFSNLSDPSGLKVNSASELLAERYFTLTQDRMTVEEIAAALEASFDTDVKTDTMLLWRAWRQSDMDVVNTDGDPGEGGYGRMGYELVIGDFSIAAVGTLPYTDTAAPGTLQFESKGAGALGLYSNDTLVLCYSEPVYLELKNDTSADGADTAEKWKQTIIGKMSKDPVDGTNVINGLSLMEAAEVWDSTENKYMALAEDRATVTPSKNGGDVKLRVIGGKGLDYSLRGAFDNPSQEISVSQNNVWKANLSIRQAVDYTITGTLDTSLDTTLIDFIDIVPTYVPLVIQKKWDPETYTGIDSVEFTVYGHKDAADTAGTPLAAKDEAGHVVTELTKNDTAIIDGQEKTWAKVVYVSHTYGADSGVFESYTVKENLDALRADDHTVQWAAVETDMKSEWQPLKDGYVTGYVKLYRTDRVKDNSYENVKRIEFVFSDAEGVDFYSSVVDFGEVRKNCAPIERYYYVKVRMPASINFTTARLLCTERADNVPAVYSDPTGRLEKGILDTSNRVYGIVLDSDSGIGLPAYKQKGTANVARYAFTDVEFLHEDAILSDADYATALAAGNVWTGTETLYTFPHVQDNPRLVVTNHAYICKIEQFAAVDASGSRLGLYNTEAEAQAAANVSSVEKVETCFTSLNAAVAYARSGSITMDAAHPVTIQMLVDYAMPYSDRVELDQSGDNIVLTTAAASGDTYNFAPTFDAEHGRAVEDSKTSAIIKREFGEDTALFWVTNGAKLALAGLDRGIILDGNKNDYPDVSVNGNLVHVKSYRKDGKYSSLAIQDNAVLRNAYSANSLPDTGGGAVFANGGIDDLSKPDDSYAEVVMTGGVIENCSAAKFGGGILGDWGAVVSISGGTIRNCEVPKNVDSKGGGIMVSRGVLNVSGSAKIENNTAKAGGGICVINDAYLSMTGGELSNNSADDKGGAIYVENGGHAAVSGGTISSNTIIGTTGSGSAVYLGENGILTVSGGSISGNTVSDAFGAVEAADATARLYFSGVPTVYDNTYTSGGSTVQKNVVLPVDSNAVINTTGLTGGSVGVYVPDTAIGEGQSASTLYKEHGEILDPFGTYSDDTAAGDIALANQQLYHFINDRNGLTGAARTDDHRLVWIKVVPLKVTKVLADANGSGTDEFIFTPAVEGTGGNHTYYWTDGTSYQTFTEGSTGYGVSFTLKKDDTGTADVREDQYTVNMIAGVPAALAESMTDTSLLDQYVTTVMTASGMTGGTTVAEGSHTAGFTIAESASEAALTVENSKENCVITVRNELRDYMTNVGAVFNYEATIISKEGTPIANSVVGYIMREHVVTKEEAESEENMSLPENQRLREGEKIEVKEDIYTDANGRVVSKEGSSTVSGFKLAAKEEIVLAVPAGVYLTVTQELKDGYETAAGSENGTTNEAPEADRNHVFKGTFNGGDTIVFTNSLIGHKLRIKVVGSDAAHQAGLGDAVFEMACPEQNVALGRLTSSSEDGFIESLDPDDTKLFVMPYAGVYTIHQTKAPDHYTAVGDVRLNVTSVGIELTKVGEDGEAPFDGAVLSKDEGSGVYTLTITNTLKSARVTVIMNAGHGNEDSTYRFEATGLGAGSFELRGSDDEATADQTENSMAFENISLNTSISIKEVNPEPDSGSLKNVIIITFEDGSQTTLTGVETGSLKIEGDITITFSQISPANTVEIPVLKTLTVKDSSGNEMASLTADAEDELKKLDFVFKIEEDPDSLSDGDETTNPENGAVIATFSGSANDQYELSVSGHWGEKTVSGAVYTWDIAQAWTITFQKPGIYKFVVSELPAGEDGPYESDTTRHTWTYYVVEEERQDETHPGALRIAEAYKETNYVASPTPTAPHQDAINVNDLFFVDSATNRPGHAILAGVSQNGSSIQLSMHKETVSAVTAQFAFDFSRSFVINGRITIPQEDGYAFAFQTNKTVHAQMREGDYSLDETVTQMSDAYFRNGPTIRASDMTKGFLFIVQNEPHAGYGSYTMNNLTRTPYAADSGLANGHYELHAKNSLKADGNYSIRYLHNYSTGKGTLTIRIIDKVVVYNNFDPKAIFGQNNWKEVYFSIGANVDHIDSLHYADLAAGLSIAEAKYDDGMKSADTSFWADRNGDGVFDTQVNLGNSPALPGEEILVRHVIEPKDGNTQMLYENTLITQLRNITDGVNITGRQGVSYRQGAQASTTISVERFSASAFNSYTLSNGMRIGVYPDGKTVFEYRINAPAGYTADGRGKIVIESALFGEPPFENIPTDTYGFRTEAKPGTFDKDFANIANFVELTYIYNDGKTANKVVSVLKNSEETLESPTRKGYEFDGWKWSKDNKVYAAGDILKVAENSTVTAQWKKKLIITKEWVEKTGIANTNSLFVVSFTNGIALSADNTAAGVSVDDTTHLVTLSKVDGSWPASWTVVVDGEVNGIEESFMNGYYAEYTLPQNWETPSGDAFLITIKNTRAICKIVDKAGEHLFSTLQSAVAYVENSATQGDLPAAKTATIEMLVDYTMPSGDTATVSLGDNITLTTAKKQASLPAGQKHYYEGTGEKASIKRGYDGASMFRVVGGTFETTDIILDGGLVFAPDGQGVMTMSGRACNTSGGNDGLGGIIKATSNGAAYGTVSVRSGTVLQNSRAENGGAIYMDGGSLDLVDVSIYNCVAQSDSESSGNGGAVYLKSGAAATENGLLIDGHSYFNLEDSDVDNQLQAQAAPANARNGGAVYIEKGASLTFTGGEIAKCKASGNGGAIYNLGSVNMTEKPVADGETPEHYNADLKRGTIEHCSAANGGAIYNAGTATLSMTGGALEYCMAFGDGSDTGNGGAIYNASTVAKTKDSEGNLSGKSAITMTEDARHPGIIDHCSAVNGGGIYVKAGELDLAGGHIEDCHATENGGAIYDITTDRMMISGVTIIGHKDLPEATLNAKKGGCVYCGDGELHISDSELYNFTAEHGGAVYHIYDVHNSKYNAAGKELFISNVRIDGHEKIEGKVTLPDTVPNATKGGVIYIFNGCSPGQAGHETHNSEAAGKIAQRPGPRLIIEGGSIINDCTARDQGGVVYCDSPARLNYYSVTIQNATINGHDSLDKDVKNAGDKGGAVYELRGYLLIGDETSSDIKVTIKNCTADEGGAVFNMGNARSMADAQVGDDEYEEDRLHTIKIVNTLIDGHDGLDDSVKNARNGGAVFLKMGIVILDGNRIVNNTADNGGAVYARSNDAGTDGSIVYMNNAASPNTITANKATYAGAGVYLFTSDKGKYQGGVLMLAGAQNFGGSDTDADGNIVPSTITVGGKIVQAGNFITTALPGGSQNGSKAYAVARQDIYISGFIGETSGVPMKATSVKVTGEIYNSEAEKDGTIWVAAEIPSPENENNHYQQLKQFALFDGNGKKLSDAKKESTMKVFRNAVEDNKTDCNGEYLFGTFGDETNYIYWSGIAGSDKVILSKKDGFYNSLEGAKFKMYKGNSSSVYVLKDKASNTSVALDETVMYSRSNGIIWIGTLPYGTYYLEETTAPAGFARKWFYYIIDGDYRFMSKGCEDRATARALAEADNAALKIAKSIINGKTTYASLAEGTQKDKVKKILTAMGRENLAT